MSQPELLNKVIQALVHAEIPYMLTGSLVSSLQGEPRSTHDIDMVVAINESQATALLAIFTSPGYYLDERCILEAISNDGMFNSRFSRRGNVKFMNMEMQVSALEDTILAKLRWAKLSGGSEKQFTDALRVYEVQYGGLDLEYLAYWVKKLGIELLWQQITEAAETM